MRSPLLALSLVLGACSAADDRRAAAPPSAPLGPDAIVLRVPTQGGAARAYRYPSLDTLIWSTRAALPAQVQPLAFSIDAGVLALSDSSGIPWRLTLGSGQLDRALAAPLTNAASLDGSGIYGMTTGGAVVRLTAADQKPWEVRTGGTVRQLQPLRNGGVLLIGQQGPQTVLARFRPPAAAVVDSAVLEGDARLISAAGGDRYYLSDGPRRLLSVRARDLETVGRIDIGDSVIATASSPSGDRVYVLGAGGDDARVQVINKYADEIVAKIAVPFDASALRMDPLGRYLLVRYGGDMDSVLVIGIATDKVLGRFVAPWRADLPLVFPDGRLATLRGNDVLVLAADTFTPGVVVQGGAKDIWTVLQWNGFRRRTGDAPLRATAALRDTTARRPQDSVKVRPAADSLRRDSTGRRDTVSARIGTTAGDSARQRTDSTRRAAALSDSLARANVARPPAPSSPATTMGERGSFVVQFAALKAERPAQQLASSIKANGEKARVAVTSTNGITLYRVILGPFRSRADAERAGQAAGRDYWVFEGGSN